MALKVYHVEGDRPEDLFEAMRKAGYLVAPHAQIQVISEIAVDRESQAPPEPTFKRMVTLAFALLNW